MWLDIGDTDIIYVDKWDGDCNLADWERREELKPERNSIEMSIGLTIGISIRLSIGLSIEISFELSIE